MATLVMKFGGSSVGTTAALNQLISIVLQECERRDNLLLVASALDGVTDSLIEAAHLARISNERGYRRIIAKQRIRHLTLADSLSINPNERSALHADIDALLFDILDLCQTIARGSSAENTMPGEFDTIIGFGERLSARIIAALLRHNGLRGVAINATDFIITDNTYGQAIPDLRLTRERITKYLLLMLDRGIVPVITGFIGATPGGQPTTLGRGGSDYTASILGYSTDADEVWIWTDVDGIMSADPRVIPEARVIPALSYDEVAELAFFGAQVLHDKMIDPLRAGNIPLWIKNIYKPRQPGTLIHNTPGSALRSLKAVTSIQGLGLNAEHSGPLSSISALADAVLYETTNSHADVMISSQSSQHSFLCFVIPPRVGPDAVHAVQAALKKKLGNLADSRTWTVRPVSVITVIGTRLNELPAVTANVFQTLSDMRILGLSHGPSPYNLSLVVEPEDAEEALFRIHRLILNTA